MVICLGGVGLCSLARRRARAVAERDAARLRLDRKYHFLLRHFFLIIVRQGLGGIFKGVDSKYHFLSRHSFLIIVRPGLGGIFKGVESYVCAACECVCVVESRQLPRWRGRTRVCGVRVRLCY